MPTLGHLLQVDWHTQPHAQTAHSGDSNCVVTNGAEVPETPDGETWGRGAISPRELGSLDPR